MKVLIINICCTGSTGRICTDIARELLRDGNEVVIAYGRGSVPNDIKEHTKRITTDLDNIIDGLRSRVLDSSGFNTKRKTRLFIDWVKEYNPDIIHLHNLHGYYLNIEILFNYLNTSKKQVVWTLHDCWAFTGHCSHFSKIDCKKWMSKCGHCPQKNEYPKSILKDQSEFNYLKKKELFSRTANMTIVTPSKWLMSLVNKSFLKHHNVITINNGINTDVFYYTEKTDRIEKYGPILKNKIILGVASIWTKGKGLEDLVWLADQLPPEYKVVIIGLTETQIKKLPSKIMKLKRTDSLDELRQWYSSATMFINPTYEDTFPTVNIESVACRTPVITYNTGGSPESMFGYGKVVKQGDREELLEAILCAGQYDVKSISLSTIDHRYRIKEYVDLYRSLIE